MNKNGPDRITYIYLTYISILMDIHHCLLRICEPDLLSHCVLLPDRTSVLRTLALKTKVVLDIWFENIQNFRLLLVKFAWPAETIGSSLSYLMSE